MSSYQRLPLTALRSFEAAARLLSFKAAAEELRVTPTSVSNQIRQLENDWGCPLFVRKTRKVILTEAGVSLSRVVSRAFDEIRAEVATHTSSFRKTVTLAVGPIFGSRWMMPRLSKFYRENPTIDLVLHHSPRINSADQLVTTIAIDWGTGHWRGLESTRLFDAVYRVVVSPQLLKARRGLRKPEDLTRYHVIHHADHVEWDAWLKLAGKPTLKFEQETTMIDSNMIIQAAIDGQGVALGIFPLIRAEVDTGRLVCPFDVDLYPTRAYHLLTRPGARALPEVKAVCAWIEAEAAATKL